MYTCLSIYDETLFILSVFFVFHLIYNRAFNEKLFIGELPILHIYSFEVIQQSNTVRRKLIVPEFREINLEIGNRIYCQYKFENRDKYWITACKKKSVSRITFFAYFPAPISCINLVTNSISDVWWYLNKEKFASFHQ